MSMKLPLQTASKDMILDAQDRLICDLSINTVSKRIAEQRATQFVNCVNAHDPLVRACQLALGHLNSNVFRAVEAKAIREVLRTTLTHDYVKNLSVHDQLDHDGEGS